MCSTYFVVLLVLCVLPTVVPGGQSFVAYTLVYHGLIKAQADSYSKAPNHSYWSIHHIGVSCLEKIATCLHVDWLFVVLLTGVSTAWSILNNRILYMGNTYVNQLRVDILLVMANLVSFDYSRFVGPCLISSCESHCIMWYYKIHRQ